MLDSQSNKKKKIDALIILHQKAVKTTTILLQNMKAKKKKNDTLVILHKINVKTINFTTINLQTDIAMNVINLI